MMQNTLLSVENLHTTFRRPGGTSLDAVQGFDLNVDTDHSVAIVGESGSGKSVSMRSLLRLLPKNAEIVSGTAEYHGRDLLSMPMPQLRSIRGQGIGMVFQNAMEALNPTLTLERQLSEVLLWHGLASKSEARQKSVRALGDVGIPDPEKRVKDYPFQFSGGMRQRAMIAMAIIAEPDLLIADEPTTALDVTVQLQILDLLRGVREARNMSLIMITHDLGVARYLCEDALVMRDSEVVERASMRDILSSPRHPYTRKLLDASIEIGDPHGDHRDAPATGSASIGGGSKAPLLQGSISEHALSSSTGAISATMQRTAPISHTENADDPSLLRATGLVKSFRTRRGVVRAVDDVSLDLPAGKTLGLVGESGSGKSTVARLIMGLDPVDEGQIRLDDMDLADPSTTGQRLARRRMQMVFQNPYGSLLPHFTAGANIAEPLRVHRIGTRGERREKVAALLELVGLGPEDAQRYPQQFSGGQQQRLAIARALITDPDILVCDEPTSALDTSIQAQIMDLLKELQGRLGLTVLLISHNLAVIQTMSDHVAVMRKGKIVETGTNTQVFSAPEHPYTQQLLDAVLPIRSDRGERV